MGRGFSEGDGKGNRSKQVGNMGRGFREGTVRATGANR